MEDFVYKTLTTDFRISLWLLDVAGAQDCGSIGHINVCKGDYFRSELKKFERNFGVNIGERIIFCRDNSFFSNSHKQGLVITDRTVYYIPNSDYPDNKIWFSWALVKSVEYDGNSIEFTFTDGDVFSIPDNLFTKKAEWIDGNGAKEIAGNLADLFNDMASIWSD